MLTERRIIKDVTINREHNAAHVRWSNQILRDGAVISETYERKAYTEEIALRFFNEVDGADNYIAALGWTTTREAAEAQQATHPANETTEAT